MRASKARAGQELLPGSEWRRLKNDSAKRAGRLGLSALITGNIPRHCEDGKNDLDLNRFHVVQDAATHRFKSRYSQGTDVAYVNGASCRGAPAISDRGKRMRSAMLMTICGLAALAGCASAADRGEFRLTADQISGAWGPVLARAQAQAQTEGNDPLWHLSPRFSGALCRWIEPGRKALCRDRVSRGFYRPGSERVWEDEAAELYLTEWGWDFGY
ncbi:MAG: hypothetical protein ACXWUX_00025 [Allosphingosinicella sp.]